MNWMNINQLIWIYIYVDIFKNYVFNYSNLIVYLFIPVYKGNFISFIHLIILFHKIPYI